MMYQFRSYGNLASSKKLFSDKKEIIAHTKLVVDKTEKYRKNLSNEDLNIVRWKNNVSIKELEEGIFLTQFDENRPKNLEIFGGECELSDKNLRDYVRGEKFRFKERLRKQKEHVTIKII
jgi:hypothetical protein